ncbi:MAG: porin [Rickettsiales bacterium]|jgi:predicted porin|nr:porin [Rickettsiales bacterium]
MKKISLLLACLLCASAGNAQTVALLNDGGASLSIDGYLVGYGLYNGTSGRSSGTNSLDFAGYGKIGFKGDRQIDKDSRFGAYVELLTDPDAGGSGAGVFRETYVYAEGGYGRFEIGRARNMPRKIHISAPDVGLLDVDGTYYLGYISPPDGFVYISSTAFTTDRESNKINYISPSFYGWQVAGSYIPGSSDLRGDSTLKYDKFRKGWTASLKYGSDWGLGFDVGLAGFRDMNTPLSEAAKRDEFSVGAKYYVRGFQVSASYRTISEDDVSGLKSQDGYAVSYGLAYEFGPVEISISNLSSKTVGDAAVAGVDRFGLAMLSGKYAVGEYVDLSASVGRIEYRFEDAASQSGPLVLAGFQVNF